MMKNLLMKGNYYPDILALVIANGLHYFVLTYIFVMIGAYSRDYWHSINEKDEDIKIQRIALFGFIISWGMFSQIERFSNTPTYLFFCLIIGLFYYGLTELVISYSNDKSMIKKILIKFLSNVSDILDNDNQNDC